MAGYTYNPKTDDINLLSCMGNKIYEIAGDNEGEWYSCKSWQIYAYNTFIDVLAHVGCYHPVEVSETFDMGYFKYNLVSFKSDYTTKDGKFFSEGVYLVNKDTCRARKYKVTKPQVKDSKFLDVSSIMPKSE